MGFAMIVATMKVYLRQASKPHLFLKEGDAVQWAENKEDAKRFTNCEQAIAAAREIQGDLEILILYGAGQRIALKIQPEDK